MIKLSTTFTLILAVDSPTGAGVGILAAAGRAKRKQNKKIRKLQGRLMTLCFFLYHIIDRYFIPGKSTSLQESGISKPTI